MPSVAKKRLLRKIFKRHDLCSNQKLASTLTIGSAFWKEFAKNKTQNMNMIRQNKLTVLLMVMDL